jgi:hypothetical protein
MTNWNTDERWKNNINTELREEGCETYEVSKHDYGELLYKLCGTFWLYYPRFRLFVTFSDAEVTSVWLRFWKKTKDVTERKKKVEKNEDSGRRMSKLKSERRGKDE